MHDHDNDEEYFVSKSQKKRDMQALQDLGEKLTTLSRDQLKKVPMSERLLEALLDMLRLTQHEARRRQLQFIGKLMRDEETAPIHAALDVFEGNSRAETARLHRLEHLRENFIEDETVLTEIGRQHPGVDLHRLRQLRRNAIKERTENRPPRAFREIFQILKEIDEGKSSSDSSDEDQDLL